MVAKPSNVGVKERPSKVARTSVAHFAIELKVPPSVLLDQLRAAGVEKHSADNSITERDKALLLEYLRKSHGSIESKNNISLTRKRTSEIKKSIAVSVRKARTNHVIKKSDATSKAGNESVDLKELEAVLGDCVYLMGLASRDPWRPADEMRLARAVNKLLADQLTNIRGQLRALAKSRSGIYKKVLRRMLREMNRRARRQEDRRKIAILAKKHPKGHLIGSTPITSYKSTGNIVWGSRARRRP